MPPASQSATVLLNDKEQEVGDPSQLPAVNMQIMKLGHVPTHMQQMSLCVVPLTKKSMMDYVPLEMI